MPRTPEQKKSWRKKRLASTPPKGHRWCQLCLRARPDAAFYYHYGERAICVSCNEQKRARTKARSDHKREVWLADPEHKAKAYKLYKAFTAKKHWIWPFYRLRTLIDDLLQYGGPAAEEVLKSISHFHYDQKCRICGKTENLQAFWPDYSKPHQIWRYCPYHRKVEAFGDTRTLAQQEKQAVKGKAEIARIRKILLDAGISHWKLVESKRVEERLRKRGKAS